MKNYVFFSAVLMFVLITNILLSQNIAITDDGDYTAHSSAMLDVKSTDKGFLPPRMTQAQRDAIIDPAAGLIVYCTDCRELQIYNGWFWTNISGNPAAGPIITVYNPTTGEIWMDRNLGADQVATSSSDTAAYGDLYQWGRLSDGHEKRTSETTSTLSNTNVPGHIFFIKAPGSPHDWRDPQNDNLWQGVNGINNPCPNGFRIPTFDEWNAERLSWASNDAAGAYGSPLKLTVGGYRYRTNGSFKKVDTVGYYWSRGTWNTYATSLSFSNGAGTLWKDRADGMSVRCIKD